MRCREGRNGEGGALRTRLACALGLAEELRVTVPAVVVAEWWRGCSDAREVVLRGVRVEDTTAALARRAGEALTAVPGATAVDAIVMASAAGRGDIVYTSDVDHLERLTTFFPKVASSRSEPGCSTVVPRPCVPTVDCVPRSFVQKRRATTRQEG